MECIEINVRKDTAEKWRKASPEMRERIERRVEIELAKELCQDLQEKPMTRKKKWNYLGSVSLGGKADKLNIRDFAHND